MINKVISVCVKADGPTFSIAARYIQEHIPARRYVVFVPEAEMEYFTSLDLGDYEVVSEERYRDIADLLGRSDLKSRFGWYFQQFIKIAELADGEGDDLNVIWDADTIPLRRIDFEIDGKVFFYQGREHHKPYFRLTRKLIGTGKIAENSFVAQCMPYRAKWFRQFTSNLQMRGGRTWYESIIEAIDEEEGSVLSEYELLGTYALSRFPGEVLLCKTPVNWYRYGNSLIGGPEYIPQHLRFLGKRFHFISFEKWDPRKRSLPRGLWAYIPFRKRGLR